MKKLIIEKETQYDSSIMYWIKFESKLISCHKTLDEANEAFDALKKKLTEPVIEIVREEEIAL